jgi:hypothetical protein
MQALERAVAWTATALKIDFGPQAKGRIGINEIDVVVAAVVVGVAEADVESSVAVAVAAAAAAAVVADALLANVEARGAERRMTGCPEKQLHAEWHCLFGQGTVSRSSFHSVEQQGWRDDQDSWVT